jgi:hypothetical protein
MKNVNGWINPLNLGRYGTDYDTRAGVAYMGLGADLHEDTVYPTAYVDGDGKPLDSANKYVMHFEKGQLPPTNVTWSVSQYQGNFYVVNALNRYAIALLALGVACWPGREAGSGSARGLLTYSLLVTLYLVYLGVIGHLAGILLWPAVVVHAAWMLLLVKAWRRERQSPGGATL